MAMHSYGLHATIEEDRDWTPMEAFAYRDWRLLLIDEPRREAPSSCANSPARSSWSSIPATSPRPVTITATETEQRSGQRAQPACMLLPSMRTTTELRGCAPH